MNTTNITTNLTGIWIRGLDTDPVIWQYDYMDYYNQYYNANLTANMWTTGCIGSRNLNNSDSRLRQIKYNDTISFQAGYKVFDRDGDIIVQSDGMRVFNYTAVDVAFINNPQFKDSAQPNASDAFI